MGAKAFSHNWDRFPPFHQQLETAYGSLSMYVGLNLICGGEGRGPRSQASRVMCLQAIDGGFTGMYKSGDITDREAGSNV